MYRSDLVMNTNSGLQSALFINYTHYLNVVIKLIRLGQQICLIYCGHT